LDGDLRRRLDDDASRISASARNIGTAPIVAGAANAALSILLYFYKIPLDWRLEGWAKTRHSILGALAIGVCGLFALDRAAHERQNRRSCLVAAALCLGFILLTGSRCPMVAIAIASLILTRARRVPYRLALRPVVEY
jgi:hypothetical protein